MRRQNFRNDYQNLKKWCEFIDNNRDAEWISTLNFIIMNDVDQLMFENIVLFK